VTRPIKDCRRLWPILARWMNRPGNECGGELHVVLGDGNLHPRFLVCDAFGRVSPTAQRICRLLLLCSHTQRAKAVYGAGRQRAK